MVWRVVCRAGMILFAIACYATESMMQLRRGSLRAGRYSSRPVFSPPSGLSPSSVRTPAIAVICYSKEAALWLQPLPPHTLICSCVAAVRRADRHPRICMLRTVAGDERSARRSLVRDYVLSLLPVCRWWRCSVRNKKSPSDRLSTS